MNAYSVPNCPWCGMPSRMHPDTHREWMTAHMDCGSEVYPPGATTPSYQSDACKRISSLASDLQATRAELERVRSAAEEVLTEWDSNHIRSIPEGYCMCGSAPHDGHDGHSFVDAADHYVNKAFADLRAALATMEPKA